MDWSGSVLDWLPEVGDGSHSPIASLVNAGRCEGHDKSLDGWPGDCVSPPNSGRAVLYLATTMVWSR